MKQFDREKLDKEGVCIATTSLQEERAVSDWALANKVNMTVRREPHEGWFLRYLFIGEAAKRQFIETVFSYLEALYFPEYDDIKTVTVNVPEWMSENILMAPRFPVNQSITPNPSVYKRIKGLYLRSTDIEVTWEPKDKISQYGENKPFTWDEVGHAIGMTTDCFDLVRSETREERRASWEAVDSGVHGAETSTVEKVIRKYFFDKTDSKGVFQTLRAINDCILLDFREPLVFHGACLNCNTPSHETIAGCFTCRYFRKGPTGPGEDKSRKYEEKDV